MHWITRIEGGPKRVNHAAVAVGERIYTFGGYCTGESSRVYCSMDVHVLNTKTFRWLKHPVSDLNYFEYDDILPYKRYGHTAVLHEEMIYVWGGRNDRSSCSVLFCFNTKWHCWTAPQTTGDLPEARDGHTACIWQDKMYIFGGYEDESDAFAKTIFVLELRTMNWSVLRTHGTKPAVRDFHTAVVLYDRMYLFGGRGTQVRYNTYSPTEEFYSSELSYLDLKTNTWHHPVIEGDKPVGRRSHSAFVYNNKMYIFGGYNALLSQHYNDLYEYDPLTNKWTCIVANGEAPNNRRRQACVVVNDRMFLFGGTSPVLPTDEPDPTNTDNLIDHSDMHVLDFRPSLKTLCKIATKKYKLNLSDLPVTLKTETVNMFSANKITEHRPNNSAG